MGRHPEYPHSGGGRRRIWQMQGHLPVSGAGWPWAVARPAPTDLYMHTLEHTARQVMVSLLDVGVDDPRRRKAVVLQ